MRLPAAKTTRGVLGVDIHPASKDRIKAVAINIYLEEWIFIIYIVKVGRFFCPPLRFD
jgi:hypothetical protein